MRTLALLLAITACGDDGSAPCRPSIDVPASIVAGERCDVPAEPFGGSCVPGGVIGGDPSVAITERGVLLRTWLEWRDDGAALVGALSGPAGCHTPVTLAADVPGWYTLSARADHFVVWPFEQTSTLELAISEDGDITTRDAAPVDHVADAHSGSRTAFVDGTQLTVDGRPVDLGEDLAAATLAAHERGVLVAWRQPFTEALFVAHVGWDGAVLVPPRELGHGSPWAATYLASGDALLIADDRGGNCGGTTLESIVLGPSLDVRRRGRLGSTASVPTLAAQGDQLWVALLPGSFVSGSNRPRVMTCQTPTFLRLDAQGEVIERTTPSAR